MVTRDVSLAENFVVEMLPGQADQVGIEYERQGAFNLGKLTNMSAVLNEDLWVVAMPPGFPEASMWIPGVKGVLGEVEHGFYSP